MPQYQEIHDLAGSLIERVTQSTESWRAFLNSAAYTYNYSFPNQLLIYHQRPTAKAVAFSFIYTSPGYRMRRFCTEYHKQLRRPLLFVGERW